jgi:hypothetical protein
MLRRLFMNGEYWFPKKTFGYGWSLPITWQGWAVLITYFVIIIALAIGIKRIGLGRFYLAIAVLTAMFIGIVYLTGEPLS